MRTPKFRKPAPDLESKGLRVAVYARCSTDRQDLSTPAQIRHLREYIKARSWITSEKLEYVDEGKTGRNTDRENFNRMLADAETGAFDVILVWKLSRFARNRLDSLMLKRQLRDRGVLVVSTSEPISQSPEGAFMEAIIEAWDECESKRIGKDTARGMKENALRGFINGGTAPLGLEVKHIPDGERMRRKLVVDEKTSSTVSMIFSLAGDGHGTKEIAIKLNGLGLLTNTGKPWNKNAVLYVLRNEIYAGVIVWNKGSTDPIRIEGALPAIISKETFDRVQRMVSARAPNVIHPRRVGSDYLLSGLARCGKCGGPMCGSAAKSGKVRYYGCTKYLKMGKRACDAGQMNRDRVETLVCDGIRNEVLTPERIRRLMDLVNEEMMMKVGEVPDLTRGVKREAEDIDRRLRKLYDIVEEGHIDLADIAPRIQELKEKKEEVESRLTHLREKSQVAPIPVPSREVIEPMLANLRSLLVDGERADRRRFIHSFIKAVTMTKEGVHVEYVLPIGGGPPQKPQGGDGTPGGKKGGYRGSRGKSGSSLDSIFLPSGGVLPIERYGSAGKARTCDPSVNSRLLYH